MRVGVIGVGRLGEAFRQSPGPDQFHGRKVLVVVPLRSRDGRSNHGLAVHHHFETMCVDDIEEFGIGVRTGRIDGRIRTHDFQP